MGEMLHDIKKFYDEKQRESPRKGKKPQPGQNSPGKNYAGHSPPSKGSSKANNGFLVTLGKDCPPGEGARVSELSNQNANHQMMVGASDSFSGQFVKDPGQEVDVDRELMQTLQGFTGSKDCEPYLALKQPSSRNINLDDYKTSNFGTAANEKSENSSPTRRSDNASNTIQRKDSNSPPTMQWRSQLQSRQTANPTSSNTVNSGQSSPRAKSRRGAESR